MVDKYDLCRDDWEKLIEQWIFNERDRAVIQRRLLDGITFERLSEEFDLSVRQIQTIVYRCQNKLLKHVGGLR